MIYFIGNPPVIPDPAITMSTMDDMVAFLETLDEIGVDTETTGLAFWEDHMVMLIAGNKEHQYVVDTRYVDIEPLKPILENNDKIKILHNMVFDYKFLKSDGNIVLENIYDTQRSEYVVMGSIADPFVSLSVLAFKYAGIEMDKTVRSSFIGMGGEEFSMSQILYGAGDIKHLFDIKDGQSEIAAEKQLDYAVRLENASYLAVAEMEYNGVKIDYKAWKALAKIARTESERIVEELNQIIVTDDLFKDCRLKFIQTDMFVEFDDLPKVNINWGSPKQVLNIMHKVDKRLAGVAEDVLKPIKNKHKIISVYLKNQEYKKRLTTYGEDFFKHVDSDGLIHTNFKTVETGRYSSDNPNLQNIPADNRYRNCFLPPKDNLMFVSADYSSQELALIAHDSQDPVWLTCLEKKEDLHSVCAELVFGEAWVGVRENDCAFYATKDITHGPDENGKVYVEKIEKRQKCECPRHKELRQAIKTINFGLAYGMTEHKLSDRVGISVGEAAKIIAKYFSTFPAIKGSLEKSALFGRVNGYIRTMTPYGRIREFPEWRGPDTDRRDMGGIERKSKNTHIQGSGADMIKEALIRVRRKIIDEKLPVLLVLTVHDQIDTVTTEEFSETWKEMLVAVMEESALSIIPSGLLKAEASISTVWKK